jgi:2-dehydropantoate 2-reductase
MAQDVNKARRTEIDFINGLIVARGKALGMAAPANAGLTEAVKRIERGECAPDLELLREI